MELLTTSAAARLLNMTTDNVRYHEREGHLLALRVQRGSGEYMRLFVREDLERFQRQRAEHAKVEKKMRGRQAACPGTVLAMVPPDA